MALIGFNFTKISVEKKKAANGKVNITNNISFINISESKVNFVDKKSALNLEFEFICKYEPGIGKIELKGSALELLEPEKVKETIESWNKNKKLPPKIAEKVMNTLLNKCYIESLILSNAINLPSPVPLPKVKLVPAKKVKK
jgi:hypothetical protein